MQPLELSTPVEVSLLSAGDIHATWAPLPAALEFSLADPIAVTLVLGAGSTGAVAWFFAFDLLHRVSTGWPTVGTGDVRFVYDDRDMKWVILRLHSPDGRATLRLNLLDVKKFVQAVKAVLDSNPSVDIVSEALDQAIYAILEG